MTMLLRTTWFCLVSVSALAGDSVIGSSQTGLFDSRYKNDVAPLFAKHCVECHGAKKSKGGLRLDTLVDAAVIQNNTEKWQTLIDQITTNQMPPEEKPRPSAKELDTIARWVADAINYVDNRRVKDPGYVLPRRLNRAEYDNTIRDLTGLDLRPAEHFPVDDSGYGFDNIADVLTMSPLLAEKYLDAAEIIIDAGLEGKGGKSELGAIKSDKMKVKKEGVRIAGGDLGFFASGEVTFPVDCVAGTEYELRASAWQTKGGTENAKAIIRLDGKDIALRDVEALEAAPVTISVKFKATAAKHDISIFFANDFYDQKTKQDRNLNVADVKVLSAATSTGNANPEFAKKVLIVAPGKSLSERAAAEQIIRNFATRAFRRPAVSEEVTKLMFIYDAVRREKDATYNSGLKRALTAVLVSPSFLFRYQGARAGTGVADLNDYEIASRLSYFLWSSMPDDDLFKLAQEKKLSSPKTREQEVRRMLADSKSREFCENFAGQWLELRNLDELMLSNKRFPEWGPGLAKAMKREGELLFDEIVKKDLSILDLINADFLYVNGPLAMLYGIKEVRGDEFKRVSAAGTGRGGILTMAGTLAVTSNPTRTSPVKRGKWILDQILGLPPPPPPPEVPSLSDEPTDEAEAPLRARLEKHRADANCAVCHNRLDGYGLALENYDALGRWRDKDGKFPVDSVGQIPGEDPIKGAAGLKQLLMKRKEQVVRSFATKMLTYAIGRGAKAYDRPTINEIVLKSEAFDYKFSSVVLAIVESDAFLKRREKRADEK